MGLQTDFLKQGRPGSPGRSAFSIPKGALTHHPQAGGGMAFGHRALSEGGLRFLRKAPADASRHRRCNRRSHSCVIACCLRKPATGSFSQFTGDEGRGTGDEGRRTKVIKIGDLPFGGKGYQPGRGPLGCGGSGLYELFPDIQ